MYSLIARAEAFTSLPLVSNYTIEREATVNDLMSKVQERRIYEHIKSLSSYPNRYFTSESGVKASLELAKKWRSITKKRSQTHGDIKIEIIKHDGWPQPSIKLQILPTDANPAESSEVIVGGHIDSINGNNHSPMAPAPGADDNASGIASMTEVLQSLIESEYKAKNTITFFAYAAEEQGMRGSMEIVESYFRKRIKVKGVINLDGTNYKGSPDIYFALLRDHTNPALNKFTGKLIEHYLKLPWGYDQCGYICSDHFSWNNRGYPVTFPAEARVSEENPYIHTPEDTLEVSDNNAVHASRFAKLALAFIAEMDK